MAHLNKKFRTAENLSVYLAAFSIPRGFKVHVVPESSIPSRADRITLLEYACDETSCPFRLYFGKKTSTFNFILECSDFVSHNHELLINKEEGRAALEKLDFSPLDNKFHLPQTWEAFVRTCED